MVRSTSHVTAYLLNIPTTMWVPMQVCTKVLTASEHPRLRLQCAQCLHALLVIKPSLTAYILRCMPQVAARVPPLKHLLPRFAFRTLGPYQNISLRAADSPKP
jgi:hypothetical protein